MIDGSKDGYPELFEKKDFIFNVLTQEENKFNKTIDQGLSILAEMQESMEKEGKKIRPICPYVVKLFERKPEKYGHIAVD